MWPGNHSYDFREKALSWEVSQKPPDIMIANSQISKVGYVDTDPDRFPDVLVGHYPMC